MNYVFQGKNITADQSISATFAPLPDTSTPIITAVGGDVTLNVGDPTYTQVSDTTQGGATASVTYLGNTTDLTSKIVTTGLPISTDKPGDYAVTYTVTDPNNNTANNTAKATRTVHVVLASSYNITASVTPDATGAANGTIVSVGPNPTTAGGVTTVTVDTDQAYTITPTSGYFLNTLVVDGTSLNPATYTSQNITTYTFNSVEKDHTIAVSFTNVPFPVIEFNSSIAEGMENLGTVNIPVTINSAYPTDIKVDYAVTGGTAVNAVDYILTDGTLTIPAGQVSANIPLILVSSSSAKPTKTVTITLSNPISATLGLNTAITYSILNNVAPITAGSAIKSTSAIISFTTDTPASSLVEYGTIDPIDPANPTPGSYNLSKSDSSFVTNHNVYLGNLTPLTEYFVRTTSTDASGNPTVSNSNFTTTAGPVISGTNASAITAFGATINWTTDIPATSYVNYSTDSGLSSPMRFGSDTPTTTHSVLLSDLSPNTPYFYSVDGSDTATPPNVGEDANGGSYYTFTTLLDNTPPVISNITTPVITDTQVAIVWDTNKLADGRVMYGATSCGTSTTCNYDSGTDLISIPLKSHLAAINGLTNNTQYYYKVVSVDAHGNSTTSPEQTFTTSATSVVSVGGGSSGVAQSLYNSLLAQNQAYESKFGTDTSNPSISNIQVSAITAFGATISFSTSKDTVAFIHYGKDTTYSSLGADNNFSQTHTIVLDGLNLGTDYNFKIDVMDRLDNVASSDNQTFTTKFMVEDDMTNAQKVDNVEQYQSEIESSIQSILPSLVPPFVDTPNITNITESGATINFKTNIKAFPAVDYTTDANYDATKSNPYDGEISDVTNKATDHSLLLTNLLPNTEYHVMAKAFSLPQVIGKSADFTFTTSASKIQASIINVKNDAFTAVWTTDTPTSSIVDYKDVKAGITQRVSDDSMNTSHSLNIENLTPGTDYEVTVSGIDAKGNLESGTPVDIKTSVDVTPPVISDLKVDSSLIVGLADQVQTIVSWTTDKPSTSAVYYEEGAGSPTAPLSNKQEDLELTLNHTVILTSMKSGTVYRFTVESTDDAGNTIKPPVRTIVTPQASQSIMDIIFKNFDDTFKFVSNVK
jgi:hypothetical protein